MGVIENLPYRLVRSARKTLSLQVKNAQIIVRAPNNLSTKEIVRFVTDKQAWLNEKVNLQKAEITELKQIQFVDGGKVWFAGQEKYLQIKQTTNNSTQQCDDHIIVNIRATQCHYLKDPQSTAIFLQKRFEQYLAQQAKTYLPKRIALLAEQLGLKPNHINIRRYKARWGSCDSKGKVSLNYLLMMCPNWVIDYVIIHELCHLQHLNHSPEFWQLVATHNPNFKQAKQWLKQHQRQLSI